MPEGGSRHRQKSRLSHEHARIFLLRQPRQLSEPPTGLNSPEGLSAETLTHAPSCQLVQELHLQLLSSCNYLQPSLPGVPWTYPVALSPVLSLSCSLWARLITGPPLGLAVSAAGEGLARAAVTFGSHPARPWEALGRQVKGGQQNKDPRARRHHPLPGKEKKGDLSAFITIPNYSD